MKLPKKWWVDSSCETDKFNSYLKYYRIYPDENGSPTSDAYDGPYYLIPAEKLEALAELVKRDPMQMSDDQVFDFANDLKKAIEQLGEGDE